MNLLHKHFLQPSQALFDYIINNRNALNILPHPEYLKEDEIVKYYLGEYYSTISNTLGIQSASLMFEATWNGYKHPDWFDHRLHFLDTEKYSEDYVYLSATHNILRLPYNGKMLSLCSGDGWYEYVFYSKRASVVDCIEIQDRCIAHAARFHSRDNIKYNKGNILEFELGENKYDLISIRGAIEHFTAEQQIYIFEKYKDALMPGGHFCGDTPAAKDSGKQLPEHEFEWKDEEEMRNILEKVFTNIETTTFASPSRTTLFWSAH